MKCRLVKMINLLLIICSFILNADCVSVDTKMREDADLSEVRILFKFLLLLLVMFFFIYYAR